MLTLLLAIFSVLWILGFLQIPSFQITNIYLFTIFSKQVSLYDFLIFLAIMWLIGILPSPLRQIISVFFIIWLLAFFGIIAIVGLPNIIVMAIIIGIIIFLLGGLA